MTRRKDTVNAKRIFNYNNHYLLAFWVSFFISISLIVGGFILPPKGEIDPSALTAVGELFLWPTLALGAKALAEGRTLKAKRGETEITIEGKENEER